MGKKKKLLSLLLVLTMAAMLFALPASAADSTTATNGGSYKTVFLPGYFGWGEQDKISKIITYFGCTSGRMNDYLNDLGYDTYTASTGPFSSGWDKACELYAQLTGTVVDYGAAHSEKYGHERYGRDYSDNPLIPGFEWNSTNKINLVGHSFGGPTARLLLDMLKDGRPEEVEAAKAAGTEPSPLFTGGKEDWIFSITTLSGTNNGTTFCDIHTDLATVVTDLLADITELIGVSDLKGVYDAHLDQFGIYAEEDETFLEAAERVLKETDFLSHHDNSLDDLYVDRSTEMNKELELVDDVYYISYYGDKTVETPFGTNVPKSDMLVFFIPFSTDIGAYTGASPGQYQDGYGENETTVYVQSQTYDEEWHANDGIVNVVSSRYPYRLASDGSRIYDDHVDHVDGAAFEKGVWNVMPALNLDHIGEMGGLLSENPTEIKALYKEIMENLDQLPVDGSAEANCPSQKFTDVDKNAWYHEPVDYVLNKGIMAGTSDTTFEPDTNLSRAMVVQMLYALEGRPTVLFGDKEFSDLEDGAYYVDAVKWASANEIVAGYEDGTFMPEQDVTREELAVILNGYAKYCKAADVTPAELDKFTDADTVSSWATESMQWAVGAGLIAGREGQTLAPQGTATRAEAAQMFTNFCKTFGK